MTDVPQRLFYRGKDVETMSRDELIAVIRDQAEWQKAFVQGAQADRLMFGQIMKDVGRRMR